MRANRWAVFIGMTAFIAILTVVVSSATAKKKMHPYDVYGHEMHNALFEAAKVECERCHADPASYGDRKKVNPMGCHGCHKDPNPPLPAPRTCTMCHPDGPPKPQSHKSGWMSKHQTYAKTNPKLCNECHTNKMFCLDCHSKRETVRQRVHRRNFKFFHSIEARANPHRCNACHTATYCQECHAGKGSSKR